MEERMNGPRKAISLIAAVVVIVCMILNWIPTSLHIGVVEIDNAFSHLNPIGLLKVVSDFDENFGVISTILPQEFDEIREQSVFLSVCAIISISLYICPGVLHLMRKTVRTDYLICAASAIAMITAVSFCTLVVDVFEMIGMGTLSHNIMSIILSGPCIGVLLGGAIGILCTEIVEEAILGGVGGIASVIMKLLINILEWAKVIRDNIGFVISDIVGAFTGIVIGRWIHAATSVTLLSVLVGLFVAGAIAASCMKIVCMVLVRGNSDREELAR